MLKFAHPTCWLLALSLIGKAQIGQSVHIVQGNAITLRADAANALSYLWFRNGEPIDGFHDQRLTVTDAGTYTVMALGNACHSDLSDPVKVIIDPGPDRGNTTVDMHIQNVPDRSVVLVGDLFTYQFIVVNNGLATAEKVVVTAAMPQNTSYENTVGPYAGDVTYRPSGREFTWLPGDMAAGQSESLTIRVRAENEGVASQVAVVTSRSIDSNPVDNQATASVQVMAIKIPNMFTPNGDGVNDYFQIGGLELFPENRIIIFNQWGNEVYKANSYKGQWNGSNLSEGTYYYIFEVRLHNGRWQAFKGFVTIVRNVGK